jgi:hypothetical protein
MRRQGRRRDVPPPPHHRVAMAGGAELGGLGGEESPRVGG